MTWPHRVHLFQDVLVLDIDITTRSPGNTERFQSSPRRTWVVLSLLETNISKSPQRTRDSPGRSLKALSSHGWTNVQLQKYSYGSSLVRFNKSVTMMLLLRSTDGDFRSVMKVRSCDWMFGNISKSAITADASKLQIVQIRCCSPLVAIWLWSRQVDESPGNTVEGGGMSGDRPREGIVVW